MPSIGDYTQTVSLLLGEIGKYLGLLAVSVLAIRLWRRLPRLSGSNRQQTIGLALAASFVASAIGYVSIRHSLGRMYYAYGLRGFSRGNIPGACGLFHTSQVYWQSADACGAEGACLLLMDQPKEGLPRLERAKSMRHGYTSGFEAHFSGLYYFFHNQPQEAVPLLKASAGYPEFRWNSDKLLAVIFLDNGQQSTAAELMQPFAELEVKECDHAYIQASFKLLENKPGEARALLDKFPESQLDDFWKPRFEKLRARTQSLASS